MILTIDNLTGLGPIDYSPAIAADVPLKIERNLNKPSILTGLIDLSGHANPLPAPARRARVIVTADNFAVLFTGYLAVEPVALYAGVATTGAVYRYEFSALSDEWLLDKQPLPLVGTTLATLAGTALRSFTKRAGGGLFTTTGVSSGRAIGVFEPSQTEVWSANAALSQAPVTLPTASSMADSRSSPRALSPTPSTSTLVSTLPAGPSRWLPSRPPPSRSSLTT